MKKDIDRSVYRIIGASNHSLEERAERDYYATDPKAVEWLVKLEKFNNLIWEPCCGEGHISEVLKKHGYEVYSTDLVDRGYGECGPEYDFFKIKGFFEGDIVTNPPYGLATEFIYKALDLMTDGSKMALFLKVTFLEGQKRRELFKKYPPKKIWVSSSRLVCAKNGDFANTKGSAVAYAWYIWEKGYKGETTVGWFN